MTATVDTVAVRFWGHVSVQGDGCWHFRPGRSPEEYRNFTFRRRTSSAHRVAWELTHGTIPDGLFVCHACDVPACVNPDHLFLGTSGDNRRDCQAKGRFQPRLHRLTPREAQQCRTAWFAFGLTHVQLMRAFGVKCWQVERAQKGLRAMHGMATDQSWRVGHFYFDRTAWLEARKQAEKTPAPHLPPSGTNRVDGMKAGAR